MEALRVCYTIKASSWLEMDSADPQPLDSIGIFIYHLSATFALSLFSP